MNVTCPNCATVYRVDPAKVPEAGVRARCAVCSAVFAVAREQRAVEAPRPPAPPVMASAPSAAPPAPTLVAAPPPAPAPFASPPPASRPTAPAVAGVGPPRPAAPARPQPPAATSAPSISSPAAAQPAPSPPGPAGRPANPFLSQDPSLKARRLARALVSDIVVYHPAKRQEGIRDGNLKQLFEEEIKKSWEEYTDQVGHDLAESTGYFREALNEILAGGRQVF